VRRATGKRGSAKERPQERLDEDVQRIQEGIFISSGKGERIEPSSSREGGRRGLGRRSDR